MVPRIKLEQHGDEAVFSLIGSFTSPDVQELQAALSGACTRVVLDLGEVLRVDLDAAHFLATAEQSGIELRRVPRYVREWIALERSRVVVQQASGPGN